MQAVISAKSEQPERYIYIRLCSLVFSVDNLMSCLKPFTTPWIIVRVHEVKKRDKAVNAVIRFVRFFRRIYGIC